MLLDNDSEYLIYERNIQYLMKPQPFTFSFSNNIMKTSTTCHQEVTTLVMYCYHQKKLVSCVIPTEHWSVFTTPSCYNLFVIFLLFYHNHTVWFGRRLVWFGEPHLLPSQAEVVDLSNWPLAAWWHKLIVCQGEITENLNWHMPSLIESISWENNKLNASDQSTMNYMRKLLFLTNSRMDQA
jgi:hypothetical protein